MLQPGPTTPEIHAQIRRSPTLFMDLLETGDRQRLIERVSTLARGAGRPDLTPDVVADMTAGDFRDLLDEVMTNDDLMGDELELVSAGLQVGCDAGLSKV